MLKKKSKQEKKSLYKINMSSSSDNMEISIPIVSSSDGSNTGLYMTFSWEKILEIVLVAIFSIGMLYWGTQMMRGKNPF
jgi:hypothetical protein